MSTISNELFEIAERLEAIGDKNELPEIASPLERLEKAAQKVGKSWSGSWIGYHARVYYADLQPVPPGARFSQEWGLKREIFLQETVGDWAEYDYEYVREAILAIAGNPSIEPAEALAKKARIIFEDSQSEIISLLTTVLSDREDPFLKNLKDKAEKAKIFYSADFIKFYRPSGQFITRDMVALGQGIHTPPHFDVLTEVMGIRHPLISCRDLAKVANRAASHIAKRERYARRNQEIGTNVFIGHGRSPMWKDLKDFVQDRLGLPWDEFNRVPVAGVTNIARLSQMLDDATFAFVIMTAEDEQVDSKMHARMNVIHEAGLFQGKLGFTKAILLLEEGCEEFSNIQGLGQIRFPKGNIKAVFEDIRQVLEREGVITLD